MEKELGTLSEDGEKIDMKEMVQVGEPYYNAVKNVYDTINPAQLHVLLVNLSGTIKQLTHHPLVSIIAGDLIDDLDGMGSGISLIRDLVGISLIDNNLLNSNSRDPESVTEEFYQWAKANPLDMKNDIANAVEWRNNAPAGMTSCTCRKCSPHLYPELKEDKDIGEPEVEKGSLFSPDKDEKTPTGRLENWFIDRGGNNEFRVVGHIYDDVRERFADGNMIHTSMVSTPVKSIAEGVTIVTKHSTYLLGKKKESEA